MKKQGTVPLNARRRVSGLVRDRFIMELRRIKRSLSSPRFSIATRNRGTPLAVLSEPLWNSKESEPFNGLFTIRS